MSGTTATSTTPRWAGALAGFFAAAAGVALGTLLASILSAPSPIESVGNRAIDFAPPFLKDFAVDNFGTADKPVLIGGVVVVLAIVAAVAGAIATRRPRLGVGIIVVLGLVALAAAASDRTATTALVLTVLPPLVTLVVAVVALQVLLGRLEVVGRTVGDDGFDRRAFLISAFGLAVVAAVGGGLSRLLGGSEAADSRASIRLPAAAQPASAAPAAAQVDVKGVSPFVTPNEDFYRIDTALRVPAVAADDWSLRIHGLVDRPFSLSYRDLLRMPLEEHRVTLTCVSNEVGGPYVGNALWLGVPVRDLLERAGVQSGADAVKSTSTDGWTCGTPLDVLTDDRNAMLAIGMNGQPLPLIHGFPARLVVPGIYGYVGSTKWVTDIEVTRFADFEAYWTPRGYDAEAPIKFSSRIDVPRSFQSFERDAVRVGGVAWAQTVGIDKVEVKVDDGPWTEADLGAEDNLETWRQWSWTWDDATEGSHQLSVRATNRDGETQTSDRAAIRPNGTTGWHSVQFRVE